MPLAGFQTIRAFKVNMTINIVNSGENCNILQKSRNPVADGDFYRRNQEEKPENPATE